MQMRPGKSSTQHSLRCHTELIEKDFFYNINHTVFWCCQFFHLFTLCYSLFIIIWTILYKEILTLFCVFNFFLNFIAIFFINFIVVFFIFIGRLFFFFSWRIRIRLMSILLSLIFSLSSLFLFFFFPLFRL